MKQKVLGLFLMMAVVSFLSADRVLAAACYDEFGGEIACTYDPATGKPLSGNASGIACTLTTNEAGTCMSDASCRTGGTGSSSVAPCVSQGQVCCRTATSPVPSATAPSGSALSGASANRVVVGNVMGTGQGLYIPPGSSLGLSDMPVTLLIQNLLNWLLYIFGFIAIIAFVISGLQYLLAAGNEKMAEKAKENMQYAMIGIVIALSALIIIRAIQAVLRGSFYF